MDDIRAHAEGLLAAVQEELGLPQMFLDERDSCSLVLDERVIVIITLDEQISSLVVNVVLGALPDDEAKTEILFELMCGNYCWSLTQGGTIGLDRDSGLITSCYRVELPQENPRALVPVIAKLAANADYWMRRIGEIQQTPPPGGQEMFLRA